MDVINFDCKIQYLLFDSFTEGHFEYDYFIIDKEIHTWKIDLFISWKDEKGKKKKSNTP